MDKIKIQDLRNLSDQEILLKKNSLKEQLYKLNYQRKLGRVEKPHMFRSIRKTIARIETIVSERKLNNLKDTKNG